jgi:GNAT superfamily N-acetyltransferase
VAALPAGVDLRPGARGDGPAIVGLWVENDELDEAAISTDLVLDHLFECCSVVVAEAAGAVVGFAATASVGPITHLTDLFVARDRQGQGIGRALLAAAFGDAAERTTFASADPRALPVYVLAGLRPWWPILYLQASPETAARLAGPPEGWSSTAEVVELDPAAAGAAGVVIGDAERGCDYRHWARRPGGVLFELRVGNRTAAVGAAAERLRGTGGQLLRLVVAEGPDPAVATLRALAFVESRLGPVALALPGPHPALRPLLHAGARIIDRDTYMASRSDLVDPARLLPHPAYL